MSIFSGIMDEIKFYRCEKKNSHGERCINIAGHEKLGQKRHIYKKMELAH